MNLAIVAGLILGQVRVVHLEIYNKGSKAGVMNVQIRLNADGSLETELGASFSEGGKEGKLRQLSKRSKEGRLTHQFMAIDGPTRESKLQIILDVGPGGTTGVVIAGGKRNQVHLPPASDDADPSVFWFIRGRPNPGTTVSYSTLQTTSMKWVAGQTTYVGDEQITVNKKKVNAHRLTVSAGLTTTKVWLDETGLPYRILQGDQKMERLP